MVRLRQSALLPACFVLLSALLLARSTVGIREVRSEPFTTGLHAAQLDPFTIGIHDACDPGTFIANVGPGTCKPGEHGTTKFDVFIGELSADHIVGAWRFNPLLKTTPGTFELATVTLSSGQQTVLHNTGGETHTFTRVESFGGGMVPPLNALSLNPNPAPECLLSPSDTNIFVEAGETEAGPTAGTAALQHGANHFQCCIHPWMRMTINVQ